MHLDAERTADILGDDADLLFLQSKVLGKNVLRHMRRLRAVKDGQALFARIPVGDDGARLVGDAGMAAEYKRRLDDFIGFREALVDFACLMLARKREIVAKLGVDNGRCGVERGLHVGNDGKFLILDFDKTDSVFRLRTGFGYDGTDGFALPARTVDGERVLRRRLDALQVSEHADPRRHHFRQFRAGDDRDHARRFLRQRGFDFFDPRMGVGRANKRDMRHARQHGVADIRSAALCQTLQIRARHRAADIGIRPVERAEDRRLVGRDFHFPAPARACAVASTASTMA